MNEIVQLPLWKSCLENIRLDGLSYGQKWSASFFEKELKCPAGSAQFAFELMALREALEKEDGYYLRSSENGQWFDIPEANAHEDVCQRLERGIRKDAVRVINLRSATLLNPIAKLTDYERSKMEKNLEKAATRLILISRQSVIERFLTAKAPNLLQLGKPSQRTAEMLKTAQLNSELSP